MSHWEGRDEPLGRKYNWGNDLRPVFQPEYFLDTS